MLDRGVVMPARKTYQNGKICRTCGAAKALTEYRVARRRPSGHICYTPDCSVCHSARLAKQYQDNKAERAVKNREAYVRDRANPERRRKRLLDGRASKAKLRAEVLAAYGAECECCGERTSEFLSIDHIRGDGVRHRKVVPGWRLYTWLKHNSWPRDNFRLLCMNCNFARGRYGACPHEIAHAALPYSVQMEVS